MRIAGMLLALAALLVPVNACAVAPTPLPASEGFAIYLLASDKSPDAVQKAALDSLVLADKPLITSADIVSYRRATHTMQLTQDGFARIKTLPRSVSGPPFVVCVDRQPIYSGSFWTSLSSASFSGVVIDTLRPGVASGALLIQLGYPGQDFFAGQDPRVDARILNALQAAGKLE